MPLFIPAGTKLSFEVWWEILMAFDFNAIAWILGKERKGESKRKETTLLFYCFLQLDSEMTDFENNLST